jgi:hypothetical protein
MALERPRHCPGFRFIAKTGLATRICDHTRCDFGAEYRFAIETAIYAGKITREQFDETRPASRIRSSVPSCFGFRLVERKYAIRDYCMDVQAGIHYDPVTLIPFTTKCWIHKDGIEICGQPSYYKFCLVRLVAQNLMPQGIVHAIEKSGWAHRFDQLLDKGDKNWLNFILNYPDRYKLFLWNPRECLVIEELIRYVLFKVLLFL